MRRPTVAIALLVLAPAVAGGPSVAGAQQSLPARPAISDLAFAPQPLRPGRTGAFRFLTTHAGAVTITIARQRAGRRARDGSCRPVTPATVLRRPCLRAVPVGRLRSAVDAGEARRRFDGRIGGRRLPPGRYLATVRLHSMSTGDATPASLTVRIAAR